MKTKTIIQLKTVVPYEDIVTLDFLYELPKGSNLYIKNEKFIVEESFDKIDEDGVTRRIRGFFTQR